VWPSFTLFCRYDLKAQKSTRTVAHLEQGIQSIFTKIGCDKNALSETLGSTGVTETNMMQYLGVIEQRCNELMHSYSVKSSQNPDPKADSGRHAFSTGAAHARGGDSSSALSAGAGPQAPAGSTVINIEPPAIGDDNNSAFPPRALRCSLWLKAIFLQVTTTRTTTRRGL
jgi:hypothetical protein